MMSFIQCMNERLSVCRVATSTNEYELKNINTFCTTDVQHVA